MESIDQEVSFEDVEMMDIEQGEVVHEDGALKNKNKNKNKSKKKKKKNRKKAMPRSDGVNIDRFVQSVCKRLREPKSYLVYTAVGVLGVSALTDLLKEVDAVQACGGQKTALGDRNRTSGGILWNILKARDPNAYKEIMKKRKDFEKQFKRPISIVQQPGTNTSNGTNTSKPEVSTSEDDSAMKRQSLEESAEPNIRGKRISVHDRIRVPVSYDDLPGEEPAKDLSPF